MAIKRITVAGVALLLHAAMGGCTFLKVNIVPEVEPLTEKAIAGEGRDKVLVLDISGIIMSGEAGPPLSGKKQPGLIAQVREAA